VKNLILIVVLLLAAATAMAILACGSGGGSNHDRVPDTSDDDDDAGLDDDDDANPDDDDNDNLDDDDNDTPGELTWENPSGSEWMTWEEAEEYCENLSLDDHDDWRLPTISELRSLVRGCAGTELGGECGVTDDCRESNCHNEPCNGCSQYLGPAPGGFYWPDGMSGVSGDHWSSTAQADHDDWAWCLAFDRGGIGSLLDGHRAHVRCVRQSAGPLAPAR
jgi:hypothetical protein